MNRNMKKAIEDYIRIGDDSSRRYAFYFGEVKQVLDMSPSVVDGVFNGLMAGFAIGYKAGRRDQKEGRR